jgi:hypothetical protein
MFAPSVKTADDAVNIGMQNAQAVLAQGCDADKAVVQATLAGVARLQKLQPPALKPGETPTPGNFNAPAAAAALRACFQTVAAGTGGAIGAALANAGLRALLQKDINITIPQACVTGLTYAHALKEMPGTTAAEQTVGTAALGAYNAVFKLDDNGRACAKVLRSALAAASGASSVPVGMSLARAAVSAMYDEDIPIKADEACEIGLNYTYAIRDTATDPTEKANAEATIKAYDAAQPGPHSAYDCATILGQYLKNEAGLGGLDAAHKA